MNGSAIPSAWASRTRPLGVEEERALTEAYRRTRDPRIEQRLVEANLRLVIKLARDHRRSGSQPLEDLVQEGSLGLIEAVRRFDPRRGVRLSTYAGYWIRAFLMRHLMDNVRMVRVIRSRADRAAFFRGVVPAADVSLDSGADADQRSLHEQVADGGPRPDSSFELAELAWRARAEAAALARRVGPRDAAILESRLLAEEPEPRAIVARRVSLSGERVRQIERSLRAALRARLDPALSAAAA